MGKVNSGSTKKVCENKTFQSQGFLHILGEAEIHTVPKAWEKWILIVRKNYGKTQTFKNYEFLKYFS